MGQQGAPIRVVTVCTANICRSPLLAVRLARGLADLAVPVDVESRGTAAVVGAPRCGASAAHTGDAPTAHRAAQVEPWDLDADLVLALARDHRAELARLRPAARPHTFTLEQAAVLATVVAATVEAGSLPEGAPPLPPADDPAARVRWLVAELDAARGTVPVDQEDVPDPHVPGGPSHEAAFAQLDAAAAALLAAVRTVLAVP